MAIKKKSVVTEVAGVLGAAAARVGSMKPKRALTTKHSKAPSTAVITADVKKDEVPAMSEREEVKLVAYLYSESRGFQGGSQDEDWTRAEQEVRKRRASKS